MTSYLLKGVLIGLLFGMPVGAVGAMTVQRAWNYGVRAGLLTGLGSSAADCLYAVVGAFGLTLISDFLLRYRTLVSTLGGALILWMGIRLLLKKSDLAVTPAKALSGAKMFLSSFAVGMTNPAAILTFLFAFSYFGISGAVGPRNGISLVCGVFMGTYLWWGALTVATRAARVKMEKSGVPGLNQVFGAVLSLFGIAVFLRILL